MATAKNEICNLSLSRLGNYDSISDIDSPESKQEKIFANWWDLASDLCLKELQPNFALHRDNIAVDATAPAFGYGYRYRKPADCVKVLGFGEIQQKTNEFSVEGEYILTDQYSGEALPLRYVRRITDITKFDPEFVNALAFVLAYFVNMEITQDVEKQSYLEQALPIKKSEAAALSGQENRPIRITNSKFNKARVIDQPSNYDKK